MVKTERADDDDGINSCLKVISNRSRGQIKSRKIKKKYRNLLAPHYASTSQNMCLEDAEDSNLGETSPQNENRKKPNFPMVHTMKKSSIHPGETDLNDVDLKVGTPYTDKPPVVQTDKKPLPLKKEPVTLSSWLNLRPRVPKSYDDEFAAPNSPQESVSLKMAPKTSSLMFKHPQSSRKRGGGFRGPYICNFPSCLESFRSTMFMRNHLIRSHLPKDKPANKKQYFCTVTTCEKSFVKLCTLNAHYKHHWPVKPYLCPEEGCGVGYATAKELRIHAIKHSDERLFECESCHFKFKRVTELNKHYKEKTSRKLKCDLCQEGFCLPMRYEAHMKKHEMDEKNKEIFQCHICSEKLPRVQKHSHIRSHHAQDPRPYKCKFCSRDFPYGAELELHVRFHTKELPYSCDTCGKGFTQKSNMKTHQKVHKIPEGMLQCLTCLVKLKNTAAFDHHSLMCGKDADYFTTEHPIKSAKNPNPRIKIDSIHRCKICPKVVKGRKEYMRDHVIRDHLKVKVYQCELCEMKFSHRTELQTHSRTHTGEKPFKCTICGKSFTQATHYKGHLAVHSEEKKFKCTICQKPFKTLGALKIHCPIHTKEKPFPCLECDMEFSSLRWLKRHTDREHLKRFPFPCEVTGCGKSFSSRSEVKLHHVHVHSDARPFPCDVCNTAFKLNGKLLEHQRSKAHKQKVEDNLKKSCTSKMKNSIKAYFKQTTATKE